MRLCECGCGEVTPARFLRGHHLRVRRPSWWKGDEVGYRAIHTYLSKHFPKTGVCEECGESSKTDYSLIKGHRYTRDRADYRELCRSCHVAYDDAGAPSVKRRAGALKRQQAGPAPDCRCGCGSRVEWDRNHSRWRSYTEGHYVGTARTLRRVTVGDA